MDEALIRKLARSCLWPLDIAALSPERYTEALDNVTDAIRGAYARGLAQDSEARALLEAWLTRESPTPMDLIAKTIAYVQGRVSVVGASGE